MCFLTSATITLLFLGGSYCSTTTDYYKNLITENVVQSSSYELPKQNAEFAEGASSDQIIDAGNFDFIIVGAGAAGNVVATRLSEVGNWSILLLEAGSEENDFSEIPAMFVYLQMSEMNWGYYTVPQTNCCLGMVNQQCMAPRGKVIGGSSSISSLIYGRGNRKDFNRWANLGLRGWSYDDVRPYFKKSENSQINGDSGYHGKGGLWNVEYPAPPTELLQTLIKGNSELNIPVLDYNGKSQLGVSRPQLNNKYGKRQSTGTAFLNDARKRKNVKVTTKALVTKILIDERNKTAQGVLFVTRGRKYKATVTKEVIVSAGAINSPQLLMLSGIGPKDHLKQLGIKVIQDSPVGETLLEQPLFPGLVFRTNISISSDSNMDDVIQQYLDGSGSFTKPLFMDGIGYIHENDVPEGVPMLAYLFVPPGRGKTEILQKVFNYNDNLNENLLKQINVTTDIVFHLILLHPQSRGKLTLNSSNPIDFPIIDFNFFANSKDIDYFIQGIKFIVNLTETEAFKRINAKLLHFKVCDNFENNSRPFWNCMLRNVAVTAYHPSGTTPMGVNSATSVVGEHMEVHGIKQLRVVDAGTFPTTISGHLTAATIMVAEKISDVIKKRYL